MVRYIRKAAEALAGAVFSGASAFAQGWYLLARLDSKGWHPSYCIDITILAVQIALALCSLYRANQCWRSAENAAQKGGA